MIIDFAIGWLLAMVYYVPLVALCINPPLFVAHNLLILFAWLSLLLIPYFLCPNKWIYRSVVLLFFIDGFLNLSHWLVLKCPLNVSSLFVLLNSNGSEAAEFISLKGSLRWLLLLPYLFLVVQAFRKVPVFPKDRIYLKIVFAALGVFALFFFGETILHGRFVRKALPDTERTLCSFSKEVKAYNSLKKRTLRVVDAQACNGSTVSVLIIGESCNRNHLSLYGYGRTTSPKLSARQDILCFTNVITPYSSTMDAIVNALSNSNIDNPIAVDNCLHLFDVYHSAGYKTFWLSNQSPIGVWDNVVFNFSQVADQSVYVNRAANSSFESTQVASYDENLFQPLTRVLSQDKASKKLIVLHLMGSHSQYDKRYPSSFSKYKGGKNKRQRTIDAYDNSILYNDFFVDSVFNLLSQYAAQHPGVRVHALYLSDHGENVYDEGENAGHDYADTVPYHNIEIPFIFWMPQQDVLNENVRYTLMRQRLDTPFMSDDLFHLMLDMDGIRTPYLQPQRSLFNADYQSARPRQLIDGKIYRGNLVSRSLRH